MYIYLLIVFKENKKVNFLLKIPGLLLKLFFEHAAFIFFYSSI